MCILWGAAVVADERALGSTPMAGIYDWLDYRWAVAAGCIAAGVLGLYALAFQRGGNQMLYFIPIQVILVLAGLNALQAMVNGHYADGEPRSRWFIFTDQLPVFMLTFAFYAALLRLAEWVRRR